MRALLASSCVVRSLPNYTRRPRTSLHRLWLLVKCCRDEQLELYAVSNVSRSHHAIFAGGVRRYK